MVDEVISKKRITEYVNEVTMDTLDDNDVIFIDSTHRGTRKFRLKGVQDAITKNQNEGIKSSGVSVTSNNYSDIITNINDQPVNTIYSYGGGLQSSIANLPSSASLSIMHYTYRYSVATGVSQVMIAIERSGENPSMYFRSTSGTPATWGSWMKVANSADIEAIRQELDNLDIETDVTLSISGKPADAKATGDAMNDVKENLNKTLENFETLVFINLFDPSTIKNGGYYKPNGSLATDANSYYTETYIPIDPNTRYSYGSSSTSIQICTYDSNKIFIERLVSTASVLNYQFNSNVAFVRTSSYRQDYSDFVFAKNDDYSHISARNPIMINGDMVTGDETDVEALHLTKTATNIIIDMGKLRYTVSHFTDNNIRVDVWRIARCDANINGSYAPVWQLSDADGVIMIDGEDDFLGGYHGDELQTAMHIFVDGVEIGETDTADTDFTELMMYIESDVYHCNTSSKADVVAFKRNKIIKFNADGYTVENCWTAQEALNIKHVYLGMLSVQKYVNNDPNQIMINGYHCNHDYILRDINTTTSGNSAVTDVVFNTVFGDIGMKLSNNVSTLPYNGFVVDYPTASIKRLKAYFENTSTTISAGDIIRGKSLIYFN